MEKKDNRGGRREGAGRPSTDSKLYTFRASGSLAKYIDSQESKTEFIKNCISRTIEASCDINNLGKVYNASELKSISIPYFNTRIVAGFPIPLDNDEKAQSIDLIKMLCPHPDSTYLIRVEGNSMIDADIYSGDIVIVDKSNRNPSEKEVAVCEFNGEYTLKRFAKKDGFGWLIPANPDFPKIKIEEDDDFSIWGTVRYVIHKPKQ